MVKSKGSGNYYEMDKYTIWLPINIVGDELR